MLAACSVYDRRRAGGKFDDINGYIPGSRLKSRIDAEPQEEQHEEPAQDAITERTPAGTLSFMCMSTAEILSDS